jgi:hypothetical protein
MRHVTWDCDGCGTTVTLDFVNSSAPLALPNMDWRTFGHWLFCSACCVYLDAAIDKIIRDKYKESK